MKNPFLYLLTATLLASCAGNNESSTSNSASPAYSPDKIYTEIAGLYFDTLPCPDCPGILTELTLYPDTTFVKTERRLTAGGRPDKSQNTKGVYSFQDNMTKIKLTSSIVQKEPLIFEVGKDVLVAISNNPSEGQDMSLELRDKNMGKYGNDYVSYRLKDEGRFPKMIYSHFPGTDIVINKPSIDGATEPQKAVMAYYASLYNTGCNETQCALEQALGLENSQVKAYSDKWMPTVNSSGLSGSEKTQSLVMLMFNMKGDILQVNYNVFSADRKMSQGIDEFAITENEARLVKHGDLKQLGKN